MSSTTVTVDRRGHGHRQHLRQVRLDQPGRAAPDGRLRARRSTSCSSRRAPQSILDVGCGEGVLTEQWAQRLGDGRVVGIDLDDPKLRARVGEAPARRTSSSASMKAENLPVRRRRVRGRHRDRGARARARPRAPSAEMARVASRWLLVSVPREPLWRGLNMARGAYLRDLGNTPGHLNHWSKRAFVSLLSPARRGRRGCARRSRGRCCSSASVASAGDQHRHRLVAAGRRARGRWRTGRRVRARRADPVGRDRRHGPLHVRVLRASRARPRRRRLRRDRAAVGGRCS